MIEYKRDNNVNTVDYWNSAWESRPHVGGEKAPIRERLMEHLGDLPQARVYEYGFGGLHLAEMVGRERWLGRDFSEVAVKNAKDAGFTAMVLRCGDAEGFRKSYLVALEVLEHLSADEMAAFLDKSRNAPHAFFSVPVSTPADEGFQQHQRGWKTEDDFRGFLRDYWPFVSVERVGRWLLAHCQTTAPVVAPTLTVGSSTLLDFSGVKWTLASWQTHHGEFDGQVEYVIVDNHPEPTVRCRGVRGFFCEECKRIEKDGPVCATCTDNLATMKAMVEGEGGRYVRWSDKQGTYPGKNQLKVEARGKWVLTMDSHVLLTPGSIRTCLEQIEDEPESDDFFHFPNLFRSHTQSHPGRPAATDFRKQQWIYHDGAERGSVYGWTGNANKAGKPYPVAAMITSCYLVRRDAWFSAKGYDPILGNYGGWEGPLQLKWWLMGRRVRQLRYRTQAEIEANGFLHHYHEFSNAQTRKTSDNRTQAVHSTKAKQRNFAASSAVIGGEWWVRRHCALKGWNFDSSQIQEGMAEGLKLRPWMIENIARPEWEDIREFFKWMRDEEKVPGALKGW